MGGGGAELRSSAGLAKCCGCSSPICTVGFDESEALALASPRTTERPLRKSVGGGFARLPPLGFNRSSGQFGAAAACLGPRGAGASTDRAGSALLVMTDTLRFPHLSLLGERR
jgi:hypothetical protein